MTTKIFESRSEITSMTVEIEQGHFSICRRELDHKDSGRASAIKLYSVEELIDLQHALNDAIAELTNPDIDGIDEVASK